MATVVTRTLLNVNYTYIVSLDISKGVCARTNILLCSTSSIIQTSCENDSRHL